MRLIAFDPGTETGWAAGEITDGRLTILDHGWLGWWPCALKYARTMDTAPFDETIFEGWRLTAVGGKTLRGSDMPWSQFIGVMKYAAHLAGTPTYEQPPAYKSVINTRMDGHKWLPASDVEHNRDAIRHLVYRAVFHHKVNAITLANGKEVLL